MLLEDATLDKFGYSISSLALGSHKRIVIQCDYCGKIFEQERKSNSHGKKRLDKDCCWGCRARKREEICNNEHGVKNPFQREDIKQKIKDNIKERFGVDYYVQTEEFKDKYKEAMLEKYGVDHSMKVDELRQKAKETNLERYGTEYASQSEEIKNRIKQTNIKRYGVENFFNSKRYKEKMNKYLKEKGVANVFQLEEIKQKIKDSNLKKYGVTSHMKVKKIALEHAKKVLLTKIKQGKVKIYKQKTISEWADYTGYSKGRFSTLVKDYGFEKAIKMTPRISYLESIFKDWFEELQMEYKMHFNVDKYIGGFYLPNQNLILELDGLYWHSEVINKDKLYHINKKNKYAELGYKSLFFREDEINNHLDIIKSMILNKCGLSTNKVFARKCNIGTGTQKFISNNHLMSRGHGSILSLFYKNEEVCSLQFFRKKDNDFEISRFCSKLNTTVIGGFSKLLRRFILDYSPSKIINFVDMRYGNICQYLLNLDFKYIHTYPSYRWTNSYVSYHWSKYPGNSGYKEGLVKIWDCGQAKYSLDLMN